jgi:hypothetical protein
MLGDPGASGVCDRTSAHLGRPAAIYGENPPHFDNSRRCRAGSRARSFPHVLCASRNEMEKTMHDLLLWAGAAILVIGLPIVLAKRASKS